MLKVVGAPCQFTSLEFAGILKEHGSQISRDGTGCWRDNVFVERLWKSIKYEEVYLHTYGIGTLPDVLQPDTAIPSA